MVSFVNTFPGEAAVVIKGTEAAVTATVGAAVAAVLAAAPRRGRPRSPARLDERAHQDREIVYFLRDPDTHAFDLFHDYTETREGMDRYVNVVRKGSTVANPSARILDTGRGAQAGDPQGRGHHRRRLDIGEPVRPDSEIVLIRFPPVARGASLRLRISETYTDPARYRLEGDELVWDRSFGRPRNAVVLPAGWRSPRARSRPRSPRRRTGASASTS